MTVERIEETFSCPDNPHLILSNIRGSVTIQSGEKDIISIVAHKHTNSGDEENTHIEMSQTNDGAVKVSTRYNHNGFRFFRRWVPCKVDYEIRVPEECTLKVRGVSNSASIAGIQGILDISSVSGDVILRVLSGEIKIKMVSGDVLGEDLAGTARLDTVSGDIKLRKSDFATISGKTVSGDLLIESPLGDGPYNFKSVSGDIKLYLTGGRGATIISSSLSGNIRHSFTSSGSFRSRNLHHLEVEGGGVEIQHKSVSGDIFLIGEVKRGDSPENETARPVGESTESRFEILEQVNQGELSVDQAVELLASYSG